MTSSLIIIFVLAIIVFLLLFKVFKSVMRAMFTAIGVLIVLLAILGVIIYVDAGNISDMLRSEKTFMLEYDGEIVSAAEFGTGNAQAAYDSGLFKTKTGEELQEINKAYKEKEYDSLVVNNESVFIFSYNYVKQEQIEVLGQTIPREEIEQILQGKDLILLDEADAKALVSVKLMVDSVSDTKIQELMKAIKDEMVILRPEPLTMTIIRNTPDYIINLFA